MCWKDKYVKASPPQYISSDIFYNKKLPETFLQKKYYLTHFLRKNITWDFADHALGQKDITGRKVAMNKLVNIIN
jgi:hypothetical protein